MIFIKLYSLNKSVMIKKGKREGKTFLMKILVPLKTVSILVSGYKRIKLIITNKKIIMIKFL